MSKLTKSAYDGWKVYLHSKQENKGKELHHIYGRIGVMLCCVLLMRMLKQDEHNSWEVRKKLTQDNYDLRLKVLLNYDKHEGCQMALDDKCYQCPLLRR